MEQQHEACDVVCQRRELTHFFYNCPAQYLHYIGRYYVDTRTFHPYVMVEHVTATPQALTCSYNSLHSILLVF